MPRARTPSARPCSSTCSITPPPPRSTRGADRRRLFRLATGKRPAADHRVLTGAVRERRRKPGRRRHGRLVQRDEPHHRPDPGRCHRSTVAPTFRRHVVQGGPVMVHADDNTILVGVTGGAVTGNHIGVGFAIVGQQRRHRKTLALIGTATDDNSRNRWRGATTSRPARHCHRRGAGRHRHLRRGEVSRPARVQVQATATRLSSNRRSEVSIWADDLGARDPLQHRAVTASPEPSPPT